MFPAQVPLLPGGRRRDRQAATDLWQSDQPYSGGQPEEGPAGIVHRRREPGGK